MDLWPQIMASCPLLSQASPWADSHGGVLGSAEQEDTTVWTLGPLPGDREGHPDLYLTPVCLLQEREAEQPLIGHWAWPLPSLTTEKSWEMGVNWDEEGGQ